MNICNSRTASLMDSDLACCIRKVRVPALHELLLHVEASQPVLLAASVEGAPRS